MGHDLQVIPPSYVKPYVKREKKNAADAAAICEAVTRPTMDFVAAQTEACSSIIVLHRTRDFLVRQRTQIGRACATHRFLSCLPSLRICHFLASSASCIAIPIRSDNMLRRHRPTASSCKRVGVPTLATSFKHFGHFFISKHVKFSDPDGQIRVDLTGTCATFRFAVAQEPLWDAPLRQSRPG